MFVSAMVLILATAVSNAPVASMQSSNASLIFEIPNSMKELDKFAASASNAPVDRSPKSEALSAASLVLLPI